jgi:hypothetical protein
MERTLHFAKRSLKNWTRLSLQPRYFSIAWLKLTPAFPPSGELKGAFSFDAWRRSRTVAG